VTASGSGAAAGPARVPRLGAATSPDARTPRLLFVPLGSTEQHGPHLPLDTDTRIAVTVADTVAARHPDTMWVAPPLAYGASGEHAGFAGTLSIGLAALELVLVELVRSAGPEFPAVVFVNGHGGNVEALERAVATARGEGRAVSWWSPRLAGGDTHAGHVETSVLLAVDPTVVRVARAEAGVTTPLAELLPALRANGVRGVAPNGVLGDPTTATADAGRRYLADFVDDLDRVARDEITALTVGAP
jgi:mycofactocin precursor peptide peptidase